MIEAAARSELDRARLEEELAEPARGRRARHCRAAPRSRRRAPAARRSGRRRALPGSPAGRARLCREPARSGCARSGRTDRRGGGSPGAPARRALLAPPTRGSAPAAGGTSVTAREAGLDDRAGLGCSARGLSAAVDGAECHRPPARCRAPLPRAPGAERRRRREPPRRTTSAAAATPAIAAAASRRRHRRRPAVPRGLSGSASRASRTTSPASSERGSGSRGSRSPRQSRARSAKSARSAATVGSPPARPKSDSSAWPSRSTSTFRAATAPCAMPCPVRRVECPRRRRPAAPTGAPGRGRRSRAARPGLDLAPAAWPRTGPAPKGRSRTG